MKDITQALPKVVADHLAAYNDHALDAMMATLAPDALVADAQREFLGHDAIRAWAEKEIFGDNVTAAVERAFDQHGDVVVHARIEGDFDKTNLPDPLIMGFYFSLSDEKITQLIIILNKVFAA